MDKRQKVIKAVLLLADIALTLYSKRRNRNKP